MRAEDFTSQQSSLSSEKQQTKSLKSSRKRKTSGPDISGINPKRRRLDTHKMKTAISAKTGKKPYCFILNQSLTHLDPVQRRLRITEINPFLMMNQAVTIVHFQLSF